MVIKFKCSYAGHSFIVIVMAVYIIGSDSYAMAYGHNFMVSYSHDGHNFMVITLWLYSWS